MFSDKAVKTINNILAGENIRLTREDCVLLFTEKEHNTELAIRPNVKCATVI